MRKIIDRTSLKIILIFMIAVSVLSITSKLVISHSPSFMSINYNEQLETLTVVINHQVNDNTTHYVNLVQIWIDNQLNQSESYLSQPSLNEFTYVYSIIASIGDEIEVKAFCNIGGSITRSIIVGETITNTVPASFICITILGLFVTGGFIRRKKN